MWLLYLALFDQCPYAREATATTGIALSDAPIIARCIPRTALKYCASDAGVTARRPASFSSESHPMKARRLDSLTGILLHPSHSQN
jgi:hypothetical protein